eukprot:GHVR01149089.1.p1 GENE.GHVR01149089.1~~GHVR01149089.1.p1  ORF type:complete len:155 (-),score=44.22 GHVR01149089.1:654-1118(-)
MPISLQHDINRPILLQDDINRPIPLQHDINRPIPVQDDINKFLTTTYKNASDKKEACSMFLKLLVDNGVKVLACDFDMTITTIHSGGCCPIQSEHYNKIIHSVSRSFDEFAVKAEAVGLSVCVVTFADANTANGCSFVVVCVCVYRCVCVSVLC